VTGKPQPEEKALQERLLDTKQATSKHVYEYKAKAVYKTSNKYTIIK